MPNQPNNFNEPQATTPSLQDPMSPTSGPSGFQVHPALANAFRQRMTRFGQPQNAPFATEPGDVMNRPMGGFNGPPEGGFANPMPQAPGFGPKNPPPFYGEGGFANPMPQAPGFGGKNPLPPGWGATPSFGERTSPGQPPAGPPSSDPPPYPGQPPVGLPSSDPYQSYLPYPYLGSGGNQGFGTPIGPVVGGYFGNMGQGGGMFPGATPLGQGVGERRVPESDRFKLRSPEADSSGRNGWNW